MRHEMVFLMPPMLLGAIAVLLVWRVPSAGEAWAQLTEPVWLRAALGALLGGFVGGLVVWLTRILGSIAFGREAMGLGDVHLMFGVGAILGGLHVTVAFFIAPFFGLLLALYMLVTRKRRELPYGPYLALGSVATLALYCRVQHYPGLHGLAMFVESLVGGSAP
jgi:leader peptidase (prepilin peptidase)/N-methyltransferase